MSASVIPEAALSQHIAIVGKVGSGKTYTAKGLVETMLDAKRRVCVLDPTGAWYGLRSSADGKKPGYPIAVFGGTHGDVPITAQSGAALARILAEKNLPAIVDLSELLIGDRHRFVTDFAETIYRENRQPLHLIIDEADEFAPQQPLPESRRMLHHVDRLVRRGRIRGFRVMLITQRPAVLHKNVLTQVNMLIAMRLTAPQDRKAIQAWVEGQADIAQGKAVMDSLARLQRGEGWVWSPEHDVLERTTFPRIRTFDSSRTPDDDETIAQPTKLAAVDIEEILASFGEIEQEAKSLVDLKAEVVQLRRELATAKRTIERHNTATVAKPAYVPPHNDAANKEMVSALQRIAVIANKIIGPPMFEVSKTINLDAAALHKPGQIRLGTTTPKRVTVSSLPSGERTVLIAIAQHHGGVTREQLTVLTGYKRSTRDAYIQRMREKALIQQSGDFIAATDLGVETLGPDFEPLPTGIALRDYWLSRLPDGEAKVLHHAIAAYPKPVARDYISAATNYARSSRDAYIQRLKSRRLVVATSSGVTASPILFD